METASTAAQYVAYLGPAATIVSAFLGFLGGTLINHWLTNRRAERKEKDRQIDICQGLIAEITANRYQVNGILEKIQPEAEVVQPLVDFENFHVIRGFYDSVKGGIGFLDWERSAELHSAYVRLEIFKNIFGTDWVKLDASLVFDELELWQQELYYTETYLFDFQRPILRAKDRKKWAEGRARPSSLAHRLVTLLRTPNAPPQP